MDFIKQEKEVIILLEKVSIKQAYSDYHSETEYDMSEAQNYHALLVSYFHCKDCAVYEDAIIDIIGKRGLSLLRKHQLIESCGIINQRKLYAL